MNVPNFLIATNVNMLMQYKRRLDGIEVSKHNASVPQQNLLDHTGKRKCKKNKHFRACEIWENA